MLPIEIKRILNETLTYKNRLVLVAVAGLIMATCDTITVNLMKRIFDGLSAGNTEAIKSTALIIIALAFFKGLSRYVHLYNMNCTSELVTQGLRQKLQMKFMRLNLSFHNGYSSGSGGLISRILNDILVIFHGLRMFADFFREPFLFIGMMGTLFYLNWRLTCAILIILPAVLWFLRQLSRSIKKYSFRGQEDLEKITSTIKESLDGVRIIQSFNLEQEMARRFEAESGNFLHSRKKIHGLVEASGPVTEFVMTLVTFGILLYMTFEVAKGHATYGDIITYIAALLMLSAPVKKMQESYVRIQETSVAAKRIFSLLDDPSEVKEVSQPKHFPENWKKIEFKNVSFQYGEHKVLHELSLTVERGQLIAFVGASGSGKSTLVNLLERFFDPTSGQILIDDVSIHDIQLSELRSKIALVTQDVFLFSDTIERNIWAGDFSKDNSRIELVASSANATKFVQKMPQGFQSRVGDRGNLLSGGEKQRISIARAFFKDAPILILDEATSALDSESEVEVQRGLDRLMEGRTAFVIAHRLSTIAKADRIYVMKAGRIVESGTHAELIAKGGEFSKLHALQYSAPNN